MKVEARKLVAIAIVAAEVVSMAVAATPASAQNAAQEPRQIRRQQQVILQQQRQIQENQRLLRNQQRQLDRQPGVPNATAPVVNRNVPRGLLGDVGGCPLGYTYSLFYGCLPHVIVN